MHYQQGAADQFYHRYAYDADNRITEVYTSSDYLTWDKDANYQYYQHRLLARMELGQQKVQGVDYAYTITGWIKGVNSTSLNTAKDLGKDGTTGSKVAKDEFGYSLSYFDGDYSAINAPQNDLQVNAGNNLYNGNIRNMTTSIRSLMQNGASQTMAYQYDQLNRLVKADAYNLQNGNLIAKNDYKASYSYDDNGNLKQLNRNAYGAGANSAGTGMDEFEYIYESKENGYERETNKLKAVIERNNTTVEYGDLKQGQSYDAANPVVDNYQYDEIGNLIKDQQEGIANIAWTVYGKIAKVEKSDGTILSFSYDAAGNRISKHVLGNGENSTTYYVRDASGNVMSIYQKDAQGFMLTEQPIYGSDMIGERKVSIAMEEGSEATEIYSHSVGLRQYHLKNNLGNILTTVADRKGGTGNAEVLSANDYYPFGMMMPGRTINAAGTRYGFNGMEKDDEMKGKGNNYDFGARIYDPRIGRWLSLDPKIKSNESPFLSFAGNPIWFKDPSGADTMLVNIITGKPIPKLMRLGGEDVIYLSGKKGTWENAQPLVYQLNISGKSGGTPSTKGEPVRWRWTNIYGVTQNLQDQSERFEEVSKKWEIYWEGKASFIEENIKPEHQIGVKLGMWWSGTTDNAPMDIKQLDNPDSFHPAVIGEWSWNNGVLSRYDDYGNINYGRSGAAFGLSKRILTTGANMNQIYKGIKGWFDKEAVQGLGDEDRDTEMIEKGIDDYEKNKTE